jgi:hypothetical protein
VVQGEIGAVTSDMVSDRPWSGLDADGNVGVGTTDPTNGRLEVTTSTGVRMYGRSSDDARVVGSFGTLTVPFTNAGVVGISETKSGTLGYSAGTGQPAVYGEHLRDGSAVFGSGGGSYPSIQARRFDEGIAVQGISDSG